MLQLFFFFFLPHAWCRPLRPWFHVSFNHFWMYLNWRFYVIPVWPLMLKDMYLGWNLGCHYKFCHRFSEVGKSVCGQADSQVGGRASSLCTWKTSLENVFLLGWAGLCMEVTFPTTFLWQRGQQKGSTDGKCFPPFPSFSRCESGDSPHVEGLA